VPSSLQAKSPKVIQIKHKEHHGCHRRQSDIFLLVMPFFIYKSNLVGLRVIPIGATLQCKKNNHKTVALVYLALIATFRQ
jgi:prolipoprotein diacylglyceryltransferase